MSIIEDESIHLQVNNCMCIINSFIRSFILTFQMRYHLF